MVPVMEAIDFKFMEDIEEDVKAGRSFDLKDKMGKLSMDTIASCGFGVDARAFDGDKSEFVEMAKPFFHCRKGDMLKYKASALGFKPVFKWEFTPCK